MYINLPETEIKLTQEQIEENFWATWKFSSHRFVEWQKGYARCSFCGALHTSTTPINSIEFPICEKNPIIVELLNKA